jgi:hypothetical protein
MRILGFVFLGTTTCVNIVSRISFDCGGLLTDFCRSYQFMKRRLPPAKTAGGVFNFKAFKYAPFSMYILATTICFFGILNG